MHVAMTWILIAAMWRQHAHRAVDALLAMLVAALTVAPLFVKQHVLFDVVLGVPWGLASYWAAKRLYERRVDPSTPPEAGLAQLVDPRRWAHPTAR
jgi:hypothetical protein